MTTPLGRLVPYSETIDESVLFPIERGQARTRIGIREPLPFDAVHLGGPRMSRYRARQAFMLLKTSPLMRVALFGQPP